jgi:hypothetical protein
MTMRVSEQMLQLSKELTDTKKVADSTANAYIKTLFMLNGKVPFKTLTFLKKTDDICKKIAEYADNTQKAIYTTITSVLSLYKDKPTYKKVYSFYYDKMMGKAKEMKETGGDSGEKTEKQKDAWVGWDEVEKKKAEMGEEVAKFCNAKNITSDQFSVLLHHLILSLYTDIAPRRNQDYLDMLVVKKHTDAMPVDHNYLDLSTKQFVFNKFKTSKTYGQQKVEIPESLMGTLACYLKQHPVGKSKKATEYRFLVYSDGSPLTAVNAITRILNKCFGKKIGSSMLRHIYITHKYGDVKGEMEKDAEEMGHSVQEQQSTYNVPH